MKAKEQKEQEESNSKVLQRGPQGCGKLLGGVLVELDGQKVEPGPDGLLRINDPRSPYHLMGTADYLQYVSSVWKRQNAKLMNERIKMAEKSDKPLSEIPKKKAPWPKWPSNYSAQAESGIKAR